MLASDDERWCCLKGGYRLPFDPRPLLKRLERGGEDKQVWDELWDELHHQGDVGEASYAAVPELVRIHRNRVLQGWDIYAIVTCIELCRGRGQNPELPDWLEKEYFAAILELARIGARVLETVKDPAEVQSILAVLALSKGARTYGELLIKYSEQELLEFDSLNLRA